MSKRGTVDFDKFLKKVPLKYREGPWSWSTYGFFGVMLGALVYLFPNASHSFQEHNTKQKNGASSSTQLAVLGAGFLWGIYVLVLMVRRIGFWPLVSYTVTSWNLMTLRLGSRFVEEFLLLDETQNAWLSAASNKSVGNVASLVSQFTKFPALAGCTVTVTVWWGVLVPVIDWILKKGDDKETIEKKRQWFRDFNKSWLLVNLHLLNLPICAAEFFWSGHNFQFYDLYAGLLVAYVYLMFYLLALDANGAHFYIILTPRPWWSFLVYSAGLGIYGLIFLGYNKALPLL